MRFLWTLAASALVSAPSIAAPRLDALHPGDLDATPSCRFVATDAGAKKRVVLEMKYWEARMRLDGTLVPLQVEEKKCLKNCVGPGRKGVRVFRLSAPGVEATLTKQVSCARHAEDCGGLQDGPASLVVKSAKGRTRSTIRAVSCDM